VSKWHYRAATVTLAFQHLLGSRTRRYLFRLRALLPHLSSRGERRLHPAARAPIRQRKTMLFSATANAKRDNATSGMQVWVAHQGHYLSVSP
jgi:hypothetical protein